MSRSCPTSIPLASVDCSVTTLGGVHTTDTNQLVRINSAHVQFSQEKNDKKVNIMH